MQSLDIISVNLWNTLLSLANLVIIFLILKKFLFKPVQKVMTERQNQVEKIYSDADDNLNTAKELKQEYDQQIGKGKQDRPNID